MMKTQMWSKVEQEIVKKDLYCTSTQTNVIQRRQQTHERAANVLCCAHGTTHAVTRRTVVLQTSETHCDRAAATTSQADTHTQTRTQSRDNAEGLAANKPGEYLDAGSSST